MHYWKINMKNLLDNLKVGVHYWSVGKWRRFNKEEFCSLLFRLQWKIPIQTSSINWTIWIQPKKPGSKSSLKELSSAVSKARWIKITFFLYISLCTRGPLSTCVDILVVSKLFRSANGSKKGEEEFFSLKGLNPRGNNCCSTQWQTTVVSV